MFAVFISDRQFFFGDPMVCWVPAHFSDSHEEYTKQYCWVRNTYYLPFDERIPRQEDTYKREYLPYYQWVPIILMVQALLFHLPCTVWRSLSAKSGIDLNDFIEKAEVLPCLPEPDEPDEESLRSKALRHLSGILVRFIKSQNQEKKMACTLSLKHILSRTCFRCCGRVHGNYLFILYMCTKVLYLANIFGQLFILNWVLGMEYHIYGFEIIKGMVRGTDWSESGAFPRVTMCDFLLRRLGNLQKYTVQCALPINLLNEKVFMFIYFWLILLAIFTLWSMLTWLLRSAPEVERYHYMKAAILAGNEDPDPEKLRSQKEAIKDFIQNFLRQDGVFVLRMIAHNVDAVTEADIVLEVWKRYCKGREQPLPPEVDRLYPKLPNIEEAATSDA